VRRTPPSAKCQVHRVGRLDYLYDRHRFEVHHYVTMASAIVDKAEMLAPNPAAGLRSATDAGEGALREPGTRTPVLRRAAAELAAAVTATLRAVAQSPEDLRKEIERQVIELSSDKIAVDRSWHLPQGLDGVRARWSLSTRLLASREPAAAGRRHAGR